MECLLDPESMMNCGVLALCVNMVYVLDCAEMICQKWSLRLLMKKAVSRQDPLLLKLVRNLSSHVQLQHLLSVSGSTIL